MGCGENSLSSNVTGLAYAEEVALKILPDGTVGEDSTGSTTASTEFTAIEIAWDDVTSRITLTGKIIAGETAAVARITQAGSVAGVVGELISINSPGTFIGTDPTGADIAQWAGNGDPETDLIAVAYIPSVANGDTFTIEFATSSAGFGSEASRVLTVTTVGTGVAKWYELEPNSYDSLGSEIETTARSPINASRQQKKGVVTDVTADGGFNSDITQTNLQRLMQGFFFAKAHERATSSSIKSVADSVTLASVAGTTITMVTGDESKFKIGSLVKLSGFSNSGNNGVFEVTALPTGALTCGAATFTSETKAVGGPQKIEIVGYEFPSADVSVAAPTGGKFVMTSAAGKFGELGLEVGEWIHVGGDAIINRLVSNAPGFARVVSVVDATLTLDQCSWATPVADTGTGKQLQIYLGTVIRNEKDPTLIKCQSYQVERTLGQDAFGTQSQYLVGAVANEFKLNIPSVEKLNADVSFQALDTETRNGSTGVKLGDRVSVAVESAFNTTSHIYQTRLYVHDPDQITPDSLFGFVMDGELTINNNVEGLKAIGTLGSVDLNVGDFIVSGSLNVYFATVAAVEAVRANSSVGFNIITALDNAGFVFDIPLLTLGGGRLDVEKDSAIMLPLETMAAENESGYTLLSTWFGYLPTVAMDT